MINQADWYEIKSQSCSGLHTALEATCLTIPAACPDSDAGGKLSGGAHIREHP